MLEELDEAMLGEAHGHTADCWPSGRGPSSSGLWKAGGGSAPIDVNTVWVGRWRGPPLASFQAETLDGIPWSEWAFPGHGCVLDRQDPLWGGRAFRGLWFVALSRSGGGINPGCINQGPSAGPRELTTQEMPLGPFELATNAPFPRLPCSGISCLFTFHRSLGLDCPPLAPPRHSGTPDALSSTST